MKLSWRRVELTTREPFALATGTDATFPSYLVTLHADDDAGTIGHGEATLNPRVTGETATSIEAFLAWARDELSARSPADWRAFLAHMHDDICGNPSARCAVDWALHDLAGQRAAVPARRLLAPAAPAAALETCMTIGMVAPEQVARLAQAHVAAGFSHLKLKLGDASADAARLRAARAAAPTATLRADANTGWTLDEARALLPELVAAGITFLEQPFVPDARGDVAMVGFAREAAAAAPGLLVCADESVADVHDIKRLLKLGFGGAFNLKLAKAGGLAPLAAAAGLAREAGAPLQLGCMVESAIAHHGGRQVIGLVDAIDLDAPFLLAHDPSGLPPPSSARLETPPGSGLGLAL